MDAKVESNLSQHFDVTEPADVNPADFAVLEAGKSFVHSLHFSFLNGVGVILDQRYFGRLPFLIWRCNESCRRSPRLAIVKLVHSPSALGAALSRARHPDTIKGSQPIQEAQKKESTEY